MRYDPNVIPNQNERVEVKVKKSKYIITVKQFEKTSGEKEQRYHESRSAIKDIQYLENSAIWHSVCNRMDTGNRH